MTDFVTDHLDMSGLVKRYSTWPTIRQQTVGEHCWSVYMVYRRLFGAPPAHVAEYIMLHDSEELIVGDAPFPVKRDNPKLKEAIGEVEEAARAKLGYALPDMEGAEVTKVKIADLLEMMTFGMRELEMGNRYATKVITRTRDMAVKMSRNDLLGASVAEAVRDFVAAETHRHRLIMEATTDGE